jgi:hypothetical protein
MDRETRGPAGKDAGASRTILRSVVSGATQPACSTMSSVPAWARPRRSHPGHEKSAVRSPFGARRRGSCEAMTNHHPATTAVKEPVRVAVVADGARWLPGLANVLAELRERGIGDHQLDITRIDEVASGIGARALSRGRHDLLHVCMPGPGAAAAMGAAAAVGLPGCIWSWPAGDRRRIDSVLGSARRRRSWGGSRASDSNASTPVRTCSSRRARPRSSDRPCSRRRPVDCRCSRSGREQRTS